MTSKCALVKALLEGKTVNIKNGFTWFGITNCPREIGRSIERSFGVKVQRTHMKGKSRYEQECTWVNYRLLPTEENKAGIEKMVSYVNEQLAGINPKTDKQVKELHKAGIDTFQNKNIPVAINPLFK